MRWAWIVVALGLLALAGCDGLSDDPQADATPSPVVSPSPEPTATAAPIPPPQQPLNFSDYATVIAGYLSANPAAAEQCLASVYEAWDMPLISADGGCRYGNTDEDPESEVVAAITSPGESPMMEFVIVVFDQDAGAWDVAFESTTSPIVPDSREDPIAPLLYAGDINGDGGGEFAYNVISCGAHTCFASIHIFTGFGGSYVALTPPEGISMSFAEITIEDVDGDGAQEVVLAGGVIGSVGAGPQRGRTETWGWDGTAYVLRETVPAAPTYLYHAILDGDQLLRSGEPAAAEQRYVTAIDDPTLGLWATQKNERAELKAYALFHAGLAVLLADGDEAAANGYFDRALAEPNTLHAQLAGAFKAGYAAKQSIGVGCQAVLDDLNENLDEYTAFWEFGYSNPPFDMNAFCPF